MSSVHAKFYENLLPKHDLTLDSLTDCLDALWLVGLSQDQFMTMARPQTTRYV